MRKRVLVMLSASAVLFSSQAQASDTLTKESKLIGTAAPLSTETKRAGLEHGMLCTDAKGAAYSLGAVTFHNDLSYRCVMVYDKGFVEGKQLAWVEIALENGVAVTKVP